MVTDHTDSVAEIAMKKKRVRKLNNKPWKHFLHRVKKRISVMIWISAGPQSPKLKSSFRISTIWIFFVSMTVCAVHTDTLENLISACYSVRPLHVFQNNNGRIRKGIISFLRRLLSDPKTTNEPKQWILFLKKNRTIYIAIIIIYYS